MKNASAGEEQWHNRGFGIKDGAFRVYRARSKVAKQLKTVLDPLEAS
jgi:hypothetical protein